MSVHKFDAVSFSKLAFAFAFTVGAATQVAAAPMVYSFEAFFDGDSVTNQIADLSFSNALLYSAGSSLNEFEFPPASGSNVLFDDGGAMSITLAARAFSVGAYFTHLSRVSFAAYDGSNNLLGSVTSLYANNLLLSGEVGSSPNEFMSFSDPLGLIARVTFTGDPAGGSFTMDDLTVDLGNAVPEPSTVALVLGLLSLGSMPGGWMRRRRPD